MPARCHNEAHLFLTPTPAKVPRIEPENHDSEEAENYTSIASYSEIGKKNVCFKCLGKRNIRGLILTKRKTT